MRFLPSRNFFSFFNLHSPQYPIDGGVITSFDEFLRDRCSNWSLKCFPIRNSSKTFLTPQKNPFFLSCITILGYNKQNGHAVALKKMKFTTVSKGLQAALLREASVMSKMANASVVRLYDSFQDDIYLYLVMEYSPLGDLEGYIEKKDGKFDLVETSHIIRELSNGLRFLRSQSIVHRDLKPANILLFHKNPSSPESRELPTRSADLACKLTDFTMARRLDDGELAKTVCGSPLYMAPEVLNRRQYTDKADLWSVGVILYRLIFNTMPFNGLNEMDLRDNLNYKPVPIPQNDPRLTPELTDLLTGLLQKDPFLRIDWEEFFLHPFLRPPRLGSTMMTDETLESRHSLLAGDSIFSDLTSISSRDAAELQKQIRDYETRLQSAQQQVKQLLGDLEQSKLREILKDQQIQKTSVGSQPSSASITSATSNHPLKQNNAGSNPSGAVASPGTANVASGPSSPAQIASPASPTALSPSSSHSSAVSAANTSSNGAQNAAGNPHKGMIKFSDAPASGARQSEHSNPSSNNSSTLTAESHRTSATSRQVAELAASTISERLQRLSGSPHGRNGANSDSKYEEDAYKVAERSSGRVLRAQEENKNNHATASSLPSNQARGGSPSTTNNRDEQVPRHSGTNNGRDGENIRGSAQEVASQTPIQLLLSQIHPDRAMAIDIVQQLLAEVLVVPDGDGLAEIEDALSASIANISAQKHHPVPINANYLNTASSSANPAPSSSSSAPAKANRGEGENRGEPISAASHPNAPESVRQNKFQVPQEYPYGMTPHQAAAWELERSAIISEGEEWRQLFSQVTNDYDNLSSQLDEAKTMVTVLRDDLKERDERLANHERLEQEYTRSAIQLQDQLKGQRDRVAFLEAQFELLDSYRKSQQRGNGAGER